MNQGFSPAAVLTAVCSIAILVLYPRVRWLTDREEERTKKTRPYVSVRSPRWGCLSEKGTLPWLGLGLAAADVAVTRLQPALTLLSRLLMYVLAAALVLLFLWYRRQVRILQDLKVLSRAELTKRWWRITCATLAVAAVAAVLVLAALFWHPDPAWPQTAQGLVAAGYFGAIGYAAVWIADWLVTWVSHKAYTHGLPLGYSRWLLPTGADHSATTDTGAYILSYLWAAFAVVLGFLLLVLWRQLEWGFHLLIYRTQAEVLALALAIHIHHEKLVLDDILHPEDETWYYMAFGAVTAVTAGIDALVYWIPRAWNHLFPSHPDSPAAPPQTGTNGGSHQGSLLLVLALVALGGFLWSKRPRKGKKN